MEFDTKEEAISWVSGLNNNIVDAYCVFSEDAETDDRYLDMRFDGFNLPHKSKYLGKSEYLITVDKKPAIAICSWNQSFGVN